MPLPDAELLERYLAGSSDHALAAIVEFHAPAVFSSALRQATGDARLADDIAQRVFLEFARTAPALAGRKSLAGWFFATTHDTATRVTQAETRHKARDAATRAAPAAPDYDWERLQHDVDAAVAGLPEPERDPLLLRYFLKLSPADVGSRLGLSEPAAAKSAARALEHLRRTLARHGHDGTIDSLGQLLTRRAVIAAPPDLVPRLVLAVGSVDRRTATAPAPTTPGGRRGTAILVTVLVLVLGGTLAALRHARSTHPRTTTVVARNPPAAPVAPVPRPAAAVTLNKPPTDHETAPNAAAPATTPTASVTAAAAAMTGRLPFEQWRNVGRATPDAAFQTELWAEEHQQPEIAARTILLSPEARAKIEALLAGAGGQLPAELTQPEHAVAVLLTGSGDQTPFSWIEVTGSTPTSADDVVLQTRWQYVDGTVRDNTWKYHRDADGWRRVIEADQADKLLRILQQEAAAAAAGPTGTPTASAN